VLLVIAHCDGVSVRLPNGEFVHVNDLDGIAEAIRANHPNVFLFSCETARTSDVRSFAKVLLDYGALGVVAPVTKISVREAAELFGSLLKNMVGSDPLPIGEAFLKALEETGRRTMEVWLAQSHPQVRSIPSPENRIWYAAPPVHLPA